MVEEPAFPIQPSSVANQAAPLPHDPAEEVDVVCGLGEEGIIGQLLPAIEQALEDRPEGVACPGLRHGSIITQGTDRL